MAIMIPSLLPQIEAVEIVNLHGIRSDLVSEYMAAAKSSPCVRLSGADADRIAGLWRSVPDDEQMRCHAPPYGLRFFCSNELVCEASICWRCNNIHGSAGEDRVFFEFDGSDTISQALLKECERVFGRRPSP